MQTITISLRDHVHADMINSQPKNKNRSEWTEELVVLGLKAKKGNK